MIIVSDLSLVLTVALIVCVRNAFTDGLLTGNEKNFNIRALTLQRFVRNGNESKLKECVEKVLALRKKALPRNECCLTEICSFPREAISLHPTARELILKLCDEKLYLSELSTGCCSKNSPNSINSNTNFYEIREGSATGNCTVNFRTVDKKIQNVDAQKRYQVMENNNGFTENPAHPPSTPIFESQTEVTTATSNDETENRKTASENISWTQRNSGLQFLDVPKGDELRIKDLELEEKYLIFEAFSNLMGYLQPAGFPTEMLRAALQNEVPLHILGFQIIKLEIVAVVWIIFWAILSLCVPIAVLANFCCGTNIRRLNDDISNDSMSTRERWTENSIGFLLHGLLLLLLCPIILILAGNEQISRSIIKSPMSTDIIYEDINTFIRNAHMQISFVATSSTDIAIEAIRKDLEEVVTLLGKPYQKELSTETGLETQLGALDDLKLATKEVTSLVADLLNEYESAREAGTKLQEQLKDISQQLTVVRQQCTIKDRPLCYTLQFSGFDVTLGLHNLTSNDNILQMERMDNDEKFNLSIALARKSFTDLPGQVAAEATQYIADMKSILNNKRTEVYKATLGLEILARSLTDRVTLNQNYVSSIIQLIVDWDVYRWLAVLVVAGTVSLIWGLLLCGAPCGCGLTSRTVPLLISGVSLSCVTVIAVWALGAAAFVVGVYSHSLVCQPLYDQPYYETIAKLLDSGGIFYGEEGFFKEFGEGNSTVKVGEVLKSCQRNQPVYDTFHLYTKMNIEKIMNRKNWLDLKILFSNFSNGENHLEILNPTLQINLQVLASISTVNLTTYRLQLSYPITKSDLGSFANQLNTVARQMTDPIEARKIDNLAFVIRKIVQQQMSQLIEIKNRILYKITALEMKDGFIERIENYLEDLYNHVHLKVTKDIGKCRPLWDIFHTARFSVCKLIVDPINGISASCFIIILVFVALIPVVVKLVHIYRDNDDQLPTSITHRRSRDGLIIDDEGTWATPTSGSLDSPIMDRPRRGESSLTLAWRSPDRPNRGSSEGVIPPPPRPPQIPSISRTISPKSKLSTLASRITGTRNLTHQLPSISRARTPRRGHESLRLIEPIHWKTGSTTPRSWM